MAWWRNLSDRNQGEIDHANQQREERNRHTQLNRGTDDNDNPDGRDTCSGMCTPDRGNQITGTPARNGRGQQQQQDNNWGVENIVNQRFHGGEQPQAKTESERLSIFEQFLSGR